MTTDLRVMVVDDEAIIRHGLRLILDRAEDISVVGEAADGLEAIAVARQVQPDVVLLDVRMPGVDGLQALPGLVALGAKVLVLTTYDVDANIHRGFREGASGFLLKTAHPDDLVHGIRVVARGDALLEPLVARRLIEKFTESSGPHVAPPWAAQLSVREAEVLRLMARGLANSEIAAAMHVAETTVKTHVAHVLTKLGVRDRLQAVVAAYETGWVAS
ncbi:MAG: response regulator transcription factor [Nocardioides sp.]|nr:response regulator transcription factor [Nocardioides sp.]